ncbi:conserved hypothetical protein [Pyrobaculum islandicum DSM 4184]|uniref:DUF5678 domain-containing protein n=1 Tax=Pyrobaculum islandicum (strain DSM 4184 / JCM 9189 / GEO3) TaxID=384616 RepID=A1RTB7_PYRIL|nr:hypothetical protein [Pyrobaculum islandicum]ABL88199.1 conserved hypothetical protein [Pyrobaculum islandicum DSM 4184]
MIEEVLQRWTEVAIKSGKKGWVLIKNGYIVGTFRERKDAILAAREPGIYLLIFVE